MGNANSGRRSDKQKYDIQRRLSSLDDTFFAALKRGIENDDASWGKIYADNRLKPIMQALQLEIDGPLTSIAVQVIRAVANIGPSTSHIDDINQIEDGKE